LFAVILYYILRLEIIPTLCSYTVEVWETMNRYISMIGLTLFYPEFQEMHGNIDQTLVNSLHGLLNCEIGGLDCRIIITEYKTHVH